MAGGNGPQGKWARPLAILMVYTVILGVLTVASVSVAPLVVREIRDFAGQFNAIVADAQVGFEQLTAWFRTRIPQEFQQQFDQSLESASSQLVGLVTTLLQSGVMTVVSSFSALLGFLVIPIWLFLIIKDQPRLSAWFYGLFPAWLRPDARQMVSNASLVLGRYIRAQLIAGLLVGTMTFVGLFFLGAPFPAPLAIIAGILELVPVIGPIVAGAIALLVVLALDPGWMLLWVFLLVVAIQQIENYLIIPNIQGSALNVHPALVIVLIIVLGRVLGLLGVFIAMPAYAMLRDAFVYVYRRLGEAEMERMREEAAQKRARDELEASEREAERPAGIEPDQSKAA
jgi:predicted PurR-regulated permease PerM